MAKIQGKAKKFDGTPIDYVMFFDWFTGGCIGKAVPDLAGNWSFNYYRSLNYGITYIADGCEPLTHGKYEFSVSAPADSILHYPFDGSTKDYSLRQMDGVISGNVTFTEGRKSDTKAARFMDGFVKTPSDLIIGKDKSTISFWIKPIDFINVGVIAEIGANFSTTNSFLLAINDSGAGEVSGAHNGYGITHAKRSSVKLQNEWAHVLFDIDKARAANDETRIYVNNVNVTAKLNDNDNDTSGVLNSGILYIGKRNGATLPLKGDLQDFRIYDRTLTESERNLLFTE